MMKAPAILLLTMLIGATAVAADNNALAKMRMGKLERRLSLSPQQTDQAQAILADQIAVMSAAFAPGFAAPPPTREQVRERDSIARDLIGEILDDGQKDKLSERKGRILPEPRLLELNTRLDLSETQALAVDSILAAAKPKRGKQGQPNQSDAQKPPEAGKQRGGERDVAIEAFLTPEQKAIFAEMKKERKDRKRGQRQPGGDRKRP